MRSRLDWLLVTLVGLTIACFAFLALLVGQHLYQDHETFHLMLGLTNYNLQQGKLVPMQPQPGPPGGPPVPVPTPAPVK